LPQQFVATDLLALLQSQGHVDVVPRVTEAVDGRDGGDDDDVLAREQRARRGVAQSVDLVVDRRVLVDERVRLLDVRLGLVVVVVGDEVLDGVVREEVPELLVELGRQRLVVGDDQRGLLDLIDHPRDGVCLARAGDAEERLLVHPLPVAVGQLLDGLGLVARRVERRVDPERVIDVGTVDGKWTAGVTHWDQLGLDELEKCVLRVRGSRGSSPSERPNSEG